MDKRCGTCKETLPISEFRIDPQRRDGLSPRCVKCANKAEAVSHLKLKLEAFAHLGGKCCRCGYDADHRAMAVSHVNGGGFEARRSGVRGSRLLRAVFSDADGEFQLLCWNCSTVKRIVDGERGGRTYTRIAPVADTDKWCPRCSTAKPAKDFNRNTARSDGLTSYCRSCANAYSQDSYRALRELAIGHLGGRCKSCGYEDDIRALVLDHIHGGGGADRKSGRRNRVPLNAVLAGSTDYQLLCANCNQIKQFENGERVGKRVYERAIPTTRIDRPNQRWTAEARAEQSRRSREQWKDPEHRARQSTLRSEALKARWASGEVPSQRKSSTEHLT